MKPANDQTFSSIRHLTSDYINRIALLLNEDVYGANGDLDWLEIKQRLIENIHAETNYAYAESGLMPVWHAADMIKSVWEYMDRHYDELLTQAAKAGFEFPPLPDEPL